MTVKKQACIAGELLSSGKPELESSCRQQTVGWSCRKSPSWQVTEARAEVNE